MLRLHKLGAVVALVCAALASVATAQLPSGFQDQLVVSGLSFPVGVAFHPDGRTLASGSSDHTLRL